MFTNIMVASTKITALVDTRASDLLVAEKIAMRLGLKVSKGNKCTKTINSKEVPTMGVAQGVELQLEDWKGKEKIEVIPLDDYDFVVSLDFLDHIIALFVPFANCLCILDTWCQCIMLVKRKFGQGSKVLSAIQLVKGVRREEVTYLATLKHEEHVEAKDETSLEVLEVLESFRDVMPLQLPKTLLLKREVDYKIELVPNAQPPAKAPYKMSSSELEELRKQLNELVDARHIRPLKAPYGALVLLQRKHDGLLRLYIDYRALNKHPIPFIVDLSDQLGDATWFTNWT